MDTVSSLVFRNGRNLALPLAALALSGLVLILLAALAQLLGAATVEPMPEVRFAPFRWREEGGVA